MRNSRSGELWVTSTEKKCRLGVDGKMLSDGMWRLREQEVSRGFFEEGEGEITDWVCSDELAYE